MTMIDFFLSCCALQGIWKTRLSVSR